MTDQGDQKTFRSSDNLWSRVSEKTPDVRPNGLATGGIVSVGVSGSNNKIDVAALNCYLAGVLTAVGASADEDVTRATPTDTHIINSVTITSAGAIAIIAGTDGTGFSETRGAAGGPPWIPTGSIEIAQVRLSSNSDAPVTVDEIFMVPNVHKEMWNFPTWEIVYGEVENGVLGYAGIDFTSAMPLIHSDDAGTNTATKKVYASYNTPSFAEVPDAGDFVPPANSHSVSSKQVYGRTIGASSKSLGQGSFSAELQDGITDALLQMIDEDLWFKFKQNRSNNPYILCQGKLGVTSNFPAGDSITAACTVSALYEAMRVNG